MSTQPLPYLRFFVQAATSGSFTAAAAELGVTPAAISRNVNLLEKQLGTRLIQRNTRRMRLTAEGREYFERVQQALLLVDEAGQVLKDQREGVSGILRISTVSFFGKYVMLPLLGRFREQYPDVHVEIAFDDHNPGLVEGGFDLAIRRTPALDQNAVSRRLTYLPIAIAAHPDYLRRCGVPKTPQQLADHDAIIVRLPGGLSDVIHLAPVTTHRRASPSPRQMVHVRPRPALIVAEQLDAVMNAVIQGLGIACMSVSPALPQLHSGELKLLLPKWRVVSPEQDYGGLFLHYMQRRYQPRRLRLLIDFLTEHFRQVNPERLPPEFYAN